MMILLSVVAGLMTLNTIILLGVARNVSKLFEHEVAKLERTQKEWHARNVQYSDVYLSNQLPLSDGVDIPQLKS